MLRAITPLLVTLTLACQSERDALVSRNTELLLPKVEAAPRLPLEQTALVPQPPSEGWEIDFASSTAAGPNGELYVLQRGSLADPVIVLDMDGKVLRSWGAGLYSIPHSIRVDPDGNIWTVDAGNSHINKFNPEGERLMHINVGEMPVIESMFKGTADIAFAPDGHLFIADGYGNARVLEYGPEGRRIREWGKPGTGNGEFNLPHAIAVDERDIIYVGDRENGRIQRFDRDGNFLGMFDGLGKTYSLHLADGALWLGCQRLDQPNGSPGWLMKLNRETGEILGLVESPGTHSITVNQAGELFTGARPDHIFRFWNPAR